MGGILGMIGSGVSLFGGIESLISGANAEHQAEIAAQNAITSFESSSSQQYYNLLAGGTTNLNFVAGGFQYDLAARPHAGAGPLPRAQRDQ